MESCQNNPIAMMQNLPVKLVKINGRSRIYKHKNKTGTTQNNRKTYLKQIIENYIKTAMLYELDDST